MIRQLDHIQLLIQVDYCQFWKDCLNFEVQISFRGLVYYLPSSGQALFEITLFVQHHLWKAFIMSNLHAYSSILLMTVSLISYCLWRGRINLNWSLGHQFFERFNSFIGHVHHSYNVNLDSNDSMSSLDSCLESLTSCLPQLWMIFISCSLIGFLISFTCSCLDS